MPDKIKDKKQLIMEETGCDTRQAELVLHSTGNDVEKAIKIINSLLKQIIVIKGKFKTETANFFGLVVLIADIKLNKVLRLANIVTCNPGIYQNGLNKPWHEFERKLYALKLGEGSQPEITQKLQEYLENWTRGEKKNDIFAALVQNNKGSLEKMLAREIKVIRPDEEITLNIQLEEVNLFQFKELKEQIDEDISKLRLPEPLEQQEEIASLVLKVETIKNAGREGKTARDLQPGEMIWAKITDPRDIAQYLSKLLGGRIKRNGAEEVIPLTVPVEEIIPDKEKIRLKVKFGPAVSGEEELDEYERIVVIFSESRIRRIWKNLAKIFSLPK
ncbi:MAG: hypothetical protein HY920_07925 [Elusimicrobia bacterium]|nr:hypothetical protein [Elusimicrobiota bacterium]